MSTPRIEAFFSTLLTELQSLSSKDTKVSFAIERQVKRARKRARKSDSQLVDKAVSNFKDINISLVGFKHSLTSYEVANAQLFITTILERFTTSVYEDEIQNPLRLSHIYDNWRFGPGASNGIRGTHTAEKIYQDMTCTSSCVPFVMNLRQHNPYFKSYDGRKGSLGYALVKGSKLAVVPKNEDTMRTIAIEPSGNMALQLSAGLYLEETLRYIGLDIRSQQPKNKALAQKGSINNSLATIDLKSASDLITPDLVRALFPKCWYDLLTSIRSPEIDLPDGSSIELNMISTMGNGFTFPLMTMIICSLIYAHRAQNGGPTLFLDWSSTCVFGDDIIIPTHEYDDVCNLLERAGFIVNHDKSYCDGPFRESCGGDYFEGYDVTPFYVKSIANDSQIYVAMNQLCDWAGRHRLFMSDTLSFLHSCLNGKLHLIPEWCNPDQGLLSSGCPRRYTYLKKQQHRQRLKDDWFAMPLAIGGYLVPSETDLFFLPRSDFSRYKVGRARLPKSFLDGSDPIKRSGPVSYYISNLIQITL